MSNYKKAYLTITRTDGTRKQLKFYGRTQKEADQKKMQAEAEYKAGLLVMNSNTTFARWVEEWLNVHKSHKVAPETLLDIKRCINKYFNPYLGSLPISEIRTIHIQKCLNEMSGLSQSYISHAMNYIRDIFRKASANDLIGRNPTEELEAPSVSKKPPRRALTEEERAYFMQQVYKHPYGALFGVIFACGLRPGEARGLQWGDIDFKKSTITVSRAVSRDGKTLKEPKTASGYRTVPVPDWYLDILKKKDKTSLFVFPNSQGNYMTKQHYQRAWRSFWNACDIAAGAKTAKQLGIKGNDIKPSDIVIHVLDQDVTPYYLRHTYATSLAEKEINMKAAQAWLGHSDIRMTMDVYTKASQKLLEKAGEKIKTAKNDTPRINQL